MFTIDGADGKGNASYEKDKNGKITWKNATEDTKRIGNAMLKTDIGTKKLDAMISSDNNIKIVDNKTDAPVDKEGPIIGTTKPTGYNRKGGLSETVTIYEKTIEKLTGIGHIFIGGTEDNNIVNFNSYTMEEHIGAIATHEATHATDSKSIRALSPKSTTPELEKAPYENQLEYYKELGHN